MYFLAPTMAAASPSVMVCGRAVSAEIGTMISSAVSSENRTRG
jgi:hypothetical protein